LEQRSASTKLAAMRAVMQLNLVNSGESLFSLLVARNDSDKVRLVALKALDTLNHPRLAEAVKEAQADDNELIRKEANRISTRLRPDTAIAQIRSVLEKGSVPEKQGALSSLALMSDAGVESILSGLLDKLLAGQLPRELELELFEAVAKSSSSSLHEKLKKFQENNAGKQGDFRQVLFGGNAESGKKIFFDRPEASCLRCHKVEDEGGDVGPVLTGISARQTREYLLESMIQPNATIAPGFETLLVVLKNGNSYAGVFKSENESELVINSPEDGVVKIAKADIKTRARGSSGMPDGLGEILSQRDLRDLVEYLASLK
jgi:quinoprotein glucose dehydrogenase